jgi:hypothetical protein
VPEGFCFFQRSTKVAASRLDTDADRGLESMCSNAGMRGSLRRKKDERDVVGTSILLTLQMAEPCLSLH